MDRGSSQPTDIAGNPILLKSESDRLAEERLRERRELLEERRSIRRERKIHFWTNLVLVVTTVLSAIISGFFTRESVDLAKQSASLAKAAQQSSDQTGTQTLTQMQAQSSAMKALAEAAQKSAESAKDAARIGSETLSNTRAAFRLEIRPYVTFESIRMNQALAEGVLLQIDSFLRNSGRSPATKVQVLDHFDFQPAANGCSVPSLEKFQEFVGITDIAAGGLRGPATKRAQRRLTKEEAQKIQDEDLRLCYFAIVRYHDMFGNKEPYVTQQCSYYVPLASNATVRRTPSDLSLVSCKHFRDLR